MPPAVESIVIPPTSVPLKLVAPGNGKVLVEHADELARETGMVKLPANLMATLKRHGVEVRDTGIVHTDMAYAFATKAACFKCVEELESKMEGGDVEDLVEISKAMANLSKAINGMFVKNVVTEHQQPDKPTLPRKSFAAGQSVAFHSHVHYEKK